MCPGHGWLMKPFRGDSGVHHWLKMMVINLFFVMFTGEIQQTLPLYTVTKDSKVRSMRSVQRYSMVFLLQLDS